MLYHCFNAFNKTAKEYAFRVSSSEASNIEYSTASPMQLSVGTVFSKEHTSSKELGFLQDSYPWVLTNQLPSA
jgi:hypothetical protein